MNILLTMDAATEPKALDKPSYKLHALTGNMKGFWSVTVSRNHRIVFRFENKNAYDVNLVDSLVSANWYLTNHSKYAYVILLQSQDLCQEHGLFM